MIVTGSPIEAFADALGDALEADATFMALCTGGVFASLPEASRADMPYVVIGNRDLRGDGFVMQLVGGEAAVQIDFWSIENTPHEVQAMQARARAILLRRTLDVSGYSMIGGSLTCEEELCFSDFDPDMPKRSLFHGVQRWTADLEEMS